MTQPAHMITLEPWRETSFSVRLAVQTMLLLLMPLKVDDRMTALISVLGDEILAITETEDGIDAVLDALRMQLKMTLTESPPLQSH